jgi:hypothetical protein
MNSTRRACLRLLCGAIAASCWNPAGYVPPAAPGELDRLRRTLLSLFWQRPGVRVIAEAYVRAAPQERESARRLMRAISGRRSLSAVARMPAPEIGRVIAEQIRVDFLCHRTVCIDGWIVSITEARLYALATARSAAI